MPNMRRYSLIDTEKHRKSFKKDRAVQIMLGIYVLVFSVLAIKPIDTVDWWLESIIIFVVIGALGLTYSRFRCTNRSYLCILIVLTLHTFGAHYSYFLCPVGEWMKYLFGFSRNNYDRLVYLTYGSLISLPMMEYIYRRLRLKYMQACILTIIIVLGVAVLYEIFKMFIAINLSYDHMMAFIGTQIEVWDLQKNLTFSLVGSSGAMFSCILFKIRRKRKMAMA